MSAKLVFNIETVPDIAALRRLHALPQDLNDFEVAELVFQKSRAAGLPDVLPPHLYRVVAISCVLHEAQSLSVSAFAAPAQDEPGLLQAFFDLLEAKTPLCVSWHASDFALPVLRCRALMHGVVAPNGLNLLESQHEEMCAQLSGSWAGAAVPLNEFASLCGLPSIATMSDNLVWDAWRSGQASMIREASEQKAITTWLLCLRYQRMTGALSSAQYLAEIKHVRDVLGASAAPHWRDFLTAWAVD